MSLKNGYLILYNTLSCFAWAVVLGRTLGTFFLHGPAFVPLTVGEWTQWTQTMAGLEVLHSLFGIVRAPFFTTVMQVFSRFALVWGVVHPFPYLAASPFYTSMLVAWSVTEVIRYSFFALGLSGVQPPALLWLRYNTFFVLYPLGISSEAVMLWFASGPAGEWYLPARWAIYALLAVYPPSSYILYTHMMKQRRKVMAGTKEKDVKAKQ